MLFLFNRIKQLVSFRFDLKMIINKFVYRDMFFYV